MAKELFYVNVTLQKLGKQSKPEPLLNKSRGSVNRDNPVRRIRIVSFIPKLSLIVAMANGEVRKRTFAEPATLSVKGDIRY